LTHSLAGQNRKKGGRRNRTTRRKKEVKGYREVKDEQRKRC
jgi:hypothetical protein